MTDVSGALTTDVFQICRDEQARGEHGHTGDLPVRPEAQGAQLPGVCVQPGDRGDPGPHPGQLV